MEANFFRCLARETGRVVLSRRIEKIFAPAEDVWTFRLDSRHPLRFLLFRPARSAGLFFFTDQKPVNPDTPPARAMWYRKRVAGRRILAQHVDWPGLRLAWELTPRDEPGHGRYLIFSIREDLALTDELDPAFGAVPLWPALEEAGDERTWREHPHLSPPLRQALSKLSPPEAAALYDRLQAGAVQSFHLTSGKNAIPLPWPTARTDQEFGTAMEAATAHGEQTLFPALEHQELSPERVRLKRARKRIRRAEARLKEEERVLDERRALKHQAEALQSELYRFRDLEETPERIRATHPEHGELELELDTRLSVTENMERFFKLAAKAERGFVHLARRKNELAKESARVEAGSLPPERRQREKKEAAPSLPKRYKGMAVSVFKASSGMLIIRGRNKKANHEMLSKSASPFDWWFHAAGGPSSHVILKRDHPGHEVDEATLLEAAGLCALKSYGSGGGKVEVMFALVKDVRKVKGYAHGQVAVDQVLGTVVVEPDPGLEQTLAQSGATATRRSP